MPPGTFALTSTFLAPSPYPQKDDPGLCRPSSTRLPSTLVRSTGPCFGPSDSEGFRTLNPGRLLVGTQKISLKTVLGCLPGSSSTSPSLCSNLDPVNSSRTLVLPPLEGFALVVRRTCRPGPRLDPYSFGSVTVLRTRDGATTDGGVGVGPTGRFPGDVTS